MAGLVSTGCKAHRPIYGIKACGDRIKKKKSYIFVYIYNMIWQAEDLRLSEARIKSRLIIQ